MGWNGSEPVGGPVIDPFVNMCAYSVEQSDELCYGALKTILELSPIAGDFDIGLERIMRLHGDGKATSLAAAPDSREGQRTSFQVFDETHTWDDPRKRLAHQTMSANVPKRKAADGWTLELTTAFVPGMNSIAESFFDYAQLIKNGAIENDRIFYFHQYASDRHDLTTEAGARAAALEACGESATWRDIDAIIQFWKDPTFDRGNWIKVYANRPNKSARQAFDVDKWKTLARTNPVRNGDTIVLGFDGSRANDATGIVATHVESGFQWVVGLWEKPYGIDPWSVPDRDVNDALAAIFQRYRVERMYCDPPYWREWIAQWEGEYGAEVIIRWETARYKQMWAALETFAAAIVAGTISHDGDEDLIRHLGNARKHFKRERDEHGREVYIIEKERPDSPHKIDLAMAAVLSWEARNDAIAGGALIPKRSTYEDNDLLVLGR
jgi:phage terminase large subunit-like protein